MNAFVKDLACFQYGSRWSGRRICAHGRTLSGFETAPAGHDILIVNGMHVRTALTPLVWLALALVLVRLPCAGFCHELKRTGASHCHHSDGRSETPAPGCHCGAVHQVSPPQTAHFTAPDFSFQSFSPASPATISREGTPNLPALSPPPLIGLSSILLRI